MPCRDYEYDNSASTINSMGLQNDRLARIACKAMDALVKSGQADFLLLADDEVRTWYEQHLEADRKAKEAERKAVAARAEKARLIRIKKELMQKLSADEKKALGIKG